MTTDLVAGRGGRSRPPRSRCAAWGRVTPEEFAASYWSTRPLALAGRDAWTGASTTCSARPRSTSCSQACAAHAVPPGRQGRSRPRPRALHARGRGRRPGERPGGRRPARRAFADGCTVVFQGLHRAWAPLREFSDALARELAHPVQVNAYLTPEGAQGFDAHYDTHDVFVLQTAGTKEWRIHRPVIDHPRPEDAWTRRRADVRAAVAMRAQEGAGHRHGPAPRRRALPAARLAAQRRGAGRGHAAT